MPYPITYRRPSYVPSATSRESLSGEEKQKSINDSIDSGSSCMSAGIPEALSFDRIIAGGVCPPCTVRDFMNYLKYIEHSAENLQFFLWFQDYSARWAKLPASEQSLAPQWTRAQAEAEAAAAGPMRSKRVNPQIAAVLKDTDFADVPNISTERVDPFGTPPLSSVEEKRDLLSDHGSSMGDDRTLAGSQHAHHCTAEQAFEDAGMKWKPFTTQPYRDEVTRIISIYIADGSPRELNLSARERAAVLHALQNTTHPSAFRTVATTAEYSLRKQAHPNFIRWTICNGNGARVVFARGLGIAGILAGFVADLLITLSHAPRAWRVLPLLAWFIGVATLIAAWKGMCVVLHGMHHRHLRPWELFSDDGGHPADDEALALDAGAEDEKRISHDSLTSHASNSYEDEPWIARYGKRNVIRKVFDREIWIQEPALRQIQDTIFLQAILGALLVSAIAVGVFCAVPKGNFF